MKSHKIKKRFIFSISLFSLLSILCTQTVFSLEKNEFQVVTREGKTLTCTNLKSGYRIVVSEGKKAIGGIDSHGNFFNISRDSKYDFLETTQIDLEPESNFGFKYEMPQIDMLDQVILKVVAVFPHPIEIKGKKETSISVDYEYDDRSSNEQYITWTFKEEEQHYFVKGGWKLEVYNKDNLVISETFTVK